MTTRTPEEDALARLVTWNAICIFFDLMRTPDLFAEWREPGFPQDRLEAFASQTGWPCAPPGDEK